MITRTIVQVSPPRSRRQSISPDGTSLLRVQRSCSSTMCSRTSSTSAESEKHDKVGDEVVSAIETLTTRQKPMNRIASQGRSERDSAKVPTYAEVHTVAPRKRTNTVGSVAASPARTWVIQLFTFTARFTTRSRNGPTSDANAVESTIAIVPTTPPRTIARRVAILPLPTRIASRIPVNTSQVKCSCVTTQSACCSDSG